MMINQNTSALILIDYQMRLMPSMHESENAVASALFLAKVAKALQIPILGTMSVLKYFVTIPW